MPDDATTAEHAAQDAAPKAAVEDYAGGEELLVEEVSIDGMCGVY